MKKDRKGYEVKNVKTFKGMEGAGGYSCTLYKDGKRIAECIDDDSGGEIMVRYFDFNVPKIEMERVNFRGDKFTYKATPEEKAFLEYIISLGSYECLGSEFNYCEHTVIDEMVNEFLDNKRFKQQCKKKTLFSLKSDEEGQHWVLDAPYEERVRIHLLEKHGDNLDEIINMRFL